MTITSGKLPDDLAGAALLADAEIQARAFGALLLALVADRVNTACSARPPRQALRHLGTAVADIGWLHGRPT